METISEMISELETRNLSNAVADSYIEAMNLDIEHIDRALKICQEKIEQPLWDLHLCFLDGDFEAVEETAKQVQIFQAAYEILKSYKMGLEKVVIEGQQLQVKKPQLTLQKVSANPLQVKA